MNDPDINDSELHKTTVIPLIGEPIQKFKCSKGHQWVRLPFENTQDFISFVWDDLQVQNLCLRCVAEFCKNNMGVVEEVK